MKRENKVLKTVADLVDYVVDSRFDASRKWDLDMRIEDEWDDKLVGEVWQTEMNSMSNLLWDMRYHNVDGKYTAEDIAKLDAQYEAQRKLMPSKHQVTYYWLNQKSSDRWHSGPSITISAELGEMIAKVWTKVPAYRGASYTKFSPAGLTLTGILNRLGRTDIAEMINKAKADRKAADEKSRRNMYRRNVERLAQQLVDEMKKGMAAGCDFPVHLSDLVDLSEYTEE